MQKIHGWNSCSLAQVRPSGWIRSFLEHQRDGLTGHLEVAGYPFNTRGWLDDALPLGERGGTGWWPYEQNAYWYDGMIRCGMLLNDPALKKKARIQLDHVVRHVDADGFVGPALLKNLKSEYASERWPYTVFLRAVMADQDERPSVATLKKLIRHYLSNTARHETARNICNIEIMAWLYEKTGDRRMLELALESYRIYQDKEAKHGATLKNMASRKPARDHGPTYMELFKLGAVMYRVTGNRTFLNASVNAVRKLNRDHVLIDGVPSTTEHLRGIYSTAGHKTCVISDYLWSLGYMLMATGHAMYADAMEKIAFNALPGAVTPDFKALQYFSGPNQAIAGPQTNHHPHGTASAHISYRPNPATECCPGNVHRAMPIYAGRMWMEDGSNGIIAALYGPGRVTIGQGASRISISQETEYPFSDRIAFRFSCRKPLSFKFTFRIPGWCRKPQVFVNGKILKRKWASGTFCSIQRIYRDGDVIELHLPKSPVVVRGPEDGVGIEWGPLVMSLNIRDKRKVEKDPRSTEEFPAWTMEPVSPWNYGLITGKRRNLNDIRVETGPIIGNPWDAEHTPVRMYVPARRIPGWHLIRKKKLVQKHGDHTRVHEGNIVFTPSLPENAVRAKASSRIETIQLIPFGATRLRMTWFPRLEE